jgi:hypothetical protein
MTASNWFSAVLLLVRDMDPLVATCESYQGQRTSYDTDLTYS